MKKKIALLLVLFLLALGAGMAVMKRSGNEPEKLPEAVTLKWMLCGERYKESDVVFAKFNEELQKILPGVTVEFELVSLEEYREKWDMKMATGVRLDLAWFGNECLNYTEEVKKGSLMALDYLLKTAGEELQTEISEEQWQRQRRDGNVYAIPLEGYNYRPNFTLVANARLMERYGNLEEIVRVNQESRYTTEECFRVFEPFLQKAKENNAIGTGVSYQSICRLADKGYEGIYGTDSPFVIRIFDKNLTVYNKYEMESYKACFRVMADWYRRDFIREDVKNLLNPASEDGKIRGSILFLDEYGEKNAVPNIVPTEYEAVRRELDGYRYMGYDGCRSAFVIPKSAQYPKQAMELATLLLSDRGEELYRLLSNGIEKKHYIIVKDDIIARMSNNDKTYLYQIEPTVIGNLFRNYETKEGEFEQIRTYNREALQSPLQGFCLDTRMIAMEMERVELVVKKYKEELCQGTNPDWESLYEEFVREMKEAGSAKIVAEMQKQINEFQKAKQ